MFTNAHPCISPLPPFDKAAAVASVTAVRLSIAGERRAQRIALAAVIFFLSLMIIPGVVFAQGLLPDGAKDFFALLVGWPRTKIEYVFLAAAWCGVFAHWWNKRRLGEVSGNFAAYLMAERRDAAFSAVTAMFIYGAIMGLITVGLVASSPWPGALVGGVAIGWMIDAIVAPKA